MPKCSKCNSELKKRIDPSDSSKYYTCIRHGFVRTIVPTYGNTVGIRKDSLGGGE